MHGHAHMYNCVYMYMYILIANLENSVNHIRGMLPKLHGRKVTEEVGEPLLVYDRLPLFRGRIDLLIGNQ